MSETTKITIENNYGIYSIESKETDLTFNDLWECVVMPVILAAGYSKELIDGYFDLEHKTEA